MAHQEALAVALIGYVMACAKSNGGQTTSVIAAFMMWQVVPVSVRAARASNALEQPNRMASCSDC